MVRNGGREKEMRSTYATCVTSFTYFEIRKLGLI